MAHQVSAACLVFMTMASAAAAQTFVPTTNIRPVKTERADYPTVAEQTALEGWVEVEFTVATDGTTKDIKVLGSSSRVFERNTIAAIEKFLYEPAKVNGVPVERPGVQYRYVYAFRAEDKSYASGIASQRMASFRSLTRANEKKDDAEVTRLLQEIRKSTTLSIYEHAVLAHVEADQAIAANDATKAIAALRPIPWNVPSIPDNMRDRALVLLATLNAYDNRWTPALDAYGQLKILEKTDKLPAPFRQALEEREQRDRLIEPSQWRRQRYSGKTDSECLGSGRTCSSGFAVVLNAPNVEAIELKTDSTSLSMLRLDCASRNLSISFGRLSTYLAPSPQEKCELSIEGRKGATYEIDVLFSQ